MVRAKPDEKLYNRRLVTSVNDTIRCNELYYIFICILVGAEHFHYRN